MIGMVPIVPADGTVGESVAVVQLCAETGGPAAVPFVVNDMSILAAKPGGTPPANEAVHCSL